jgi:hypothetical protein
MVRIILYNDHNLQSNTYRKDNNQLRPTKNNKKMATEAKKKDERMLQVDKALCIKQLLDNVINWDMKGQRVMDIFKMSGDTELVAFATRYKPKQVSNLFSGLKTETKTLEEIRNEIIAKMSVVNALSTRYCEYKLFFTYLYTNFVLAFFSACPPVAGLQAPLPDPIARLKELGGKQLRSKMLKLAFCVLLTV